MNSPETILGAELQQQLQQSRGAGLWVVDENLSRFAPASPIPQLAVLTNRFDIQQQMGAAGWQVAFSDFDFSPWQGHPLERVFYRISKEKAVAHHVINRAFDRLGAGGQLVLLGAKNEGIKGYFDRARKLFGDGELVKLGKGAMLATLTRTTGEAGDYLDDRDYGRVRTIAELPGLPVMSKPGQFGWDKVDEGSRLLADHLEEIYARLPTQAPRVLDLGCGYGYLSLRAGLGSGGKAAGSIVATDNNAAALACCRDNLSRLSCPVTVVADDCGASLVDRADLVLCNPPFHQGFSVEGSLTDRFIDAAARLLAPAGQAAFVVNRFIPLARKAESRFAEVETFADNGSFKLIRLAGPIAERN